MCTLVGFVLTKEKANLDNWLKACKDKKCKMTFIAEKCGKVTESNLYRKDLCRKPKVILKSAEYVKITHSFLVLKKPF